MDEMKKPDTEGNGFTEEELATFREESLHAIEGVKRRLHRERITRGVVLSGAAAAIVIVAAFFLPRLIAGPEAMAPQVTEHVMIARLVVPDAQTETLKVFRAPPEDEPDGAGQGQPVKLQPILDLKAGDTVTVADGGVAVLYNWAKQTREKHFGPSQLKITDRGVRVVKSGGPRPDSEPVRLWAMSLEPVSTGVMRATPSEMPLPTYPVDTSIPPGKVMLQWEYTGNAEAIELTIESQTGDVLLEQKLDATEGDFSIAVNAGKPYYWKVAVPGGKAPIAQEFHVLKEADWEWVKQAAKANQVTKDDVITGVSELTDKWSLLSLYEVFINHRLYREAEATRQRLQEVLSEN